LIIFSLVSAAVLSVSSGGGYIDGYPVQIRSLAKSKKQTKNRQATEFPLGAAPQTTSRFGRAPGLTARISCIQSTLIAHCCGYLIRSQGDRSARAASPSAECVWGRAPVHFARHAEARRTSGVQRRSGQFSLGPSFGLV
jgi:hypothetical protein